MRIEREFDVAAPVDRVWGFLMDVPSMAQCIPGASGLRSIDDATHEATVPARVGPAAPSRQR
ncbi:MAG: hypothetical protein IT336_00565 [Thermomicrobiales bacterium]|nr:hypothetical protein [Thermomicrobiales bacterium]